MPSHPKKKMKVEMICEDCECEIRIHDADCCKGDCHNHYELREIQHALFTEWLLLKGGCWCFCEDY